MWPCTQSAAASGEAPVFAPEGKDAEAGIVSEEPHHPVDVQPGAVDDDAGLDVARRPHEAGAGRGAAGLAHLEAGADLVAGAGQVRREGTRHVAEVDRPGGRYVERLDAARARLALGDSVRADPLHGHAVGPAAPFEFIEGRELIARHRDHDLAGARGRDASFGAIPEQPGAPFSAEPRL